MSRTDIGAERSGSGGSGALRIGPGGRALARFARADQRPRRGENVEVALEVSLERIAMGGPEEVGYTQVIACPLCHGYPTIGVGPCPECAGVGTVLMNESLRVLIPPGLEDGRALRVPGRGLPSPDGDGEDGDLFVVVHSASDARFERRGRDLWHRELIDVADAALGTTVEVPTLTAPVNVTVEPGTQPGSAIRLPGRGLPSFEGTGDGDLYVEISVRLPEWLSAQERELYERLRTLAEDRKH